MNREPEHFVLLSWLPIFSTGISHRNIRQGKRTISLRPKPYILPVRQHARHVTTLAHKAHKARWYVST